MSAGGYRLVIEDGAIVGLAYDEDPWPWGDPRWLTSHLVADHEIRALAGWPHRCSDECLCPRCQVPMIYSPYLDEHVCPKVACSFSVGIRALTGAQLRTVRPARRV